MLCHSDDPGAGCILPTLAAILYEMVETVILSHVINDEALTDFFISDVVDDIGGTEK